MKINTCVNMFVSYSFDELTREAKDRAKNDFLFNNSFNLEEIWEEDMRFFWFPNSETNIQYSLSCCQGDGVNVYGRFAVSDLQKLIEKYGLDTFSKKEWSALAFYESELGMFVYVPENRDYWYCMASYMDFAKSVAWDLKYQNGYKNIRESLLYKFEKVCRDVLKRFCSDREKDGYDFLYDISDSDFSDMANMNEWEFDENGILL